MENFRCESNLTNEIAPIHTGGKTGFVISRFSELGKVFRNHTVQGALVRTHE